MYLTFILAYMPFLVFGCLLGTILIVAIYEDRSKDMFPILLALTALFALLAGGLSSTILNIDKHLTFSYCLWAFQGVISPILIPITVRIIAVRTFYKHPEIFSFLIVFTIFLIYLWYCVTYNLKFHN